MLPTLLNEPGRPGMNTRYGGGRPPVEGQLWNYRTARVNSRLPGGTSIPYGQIDTLRGHFGQPADLLRGDDIGRNEVHHVA